MKLILALFLLPLLAASPSAVEASNGCTPHGTQTHPPATIRVLVGRRVHTVNFRLYVARVTSSEWNNVPNELRRAGAVAVKGYGWWKALHPRRSKYGCFDVHPDTRDQIYKSQKQPPDYIWKAVNSTWSWRIIRDGKIALTGYRTGAHVGCARDVNGYKLYARSAKRCANMGWSAARILTTYYKGRLIR